MTEDTFKIFVDRLTEGQTESIEIVSDPHFMDLDGADPLFPRPVKVFGRAYVADQTLFVHLTATTNVRLPCCICNELTEIQLAISDYLHTEHVAEIKGKVYDISPIIREALLLELPPTTECGEGSCPEREKLKKYFSKSGGEYSPFQDL